LVFVKQIVDLHKGLINIKSEPNKGTSVVIKLLKNIRD
jgi:signal transduction histidine kinase